mgnify:CR=1 FL=1
MASLTIRKIPEEVLEGVRRAAAEARRSINAQVIYWLEEAARRRATAQDRDQLLARIRSTREAMRRRYGTGTDSGVLIRQMRDERTAHLLSLMKGGRAKTKRSSRA